MARIAGVNIPDEKRIEIALTYIYGIGPIIAEQLLNHTKVNPDTRAKDLTDAEVSSINNAIRDLEIPVEGELKRIVTQNIRRLGEIKSYRGLRHRNGLPTRGQRSRSNARTRKGKKKAVGSVKKKGGKK